MRCVCVLLISNTTTTTKSFWPPLSSFCDLTSGADERKRTRLETADAAAALSDCDAISGAVGLAALSATPLLPPERRQLLWQVTSCRVQENAVSSAEARRASRVAKRRLAPPMRCGELSVGGVCRCRGLGCNYSQWLSADYISANVPPSASILMELVSVAECVGALHGHGSEGVRGAPSPRGSASPLWTWDRLCHDATSWTRVTSLSLRGISPEIQTGFINRGLNHQGGGGGATARL